MTKNFYKKAKINETLDSPENGEYQTKRRRHFLRLWNQVSDPKRSLEQRGSNNILLNDSMMNRSYRSSLKAIAAVKTPYPSPEILNKH
ncbi:unnamed protein product [Cochlearia groenlandica]